MQKAHFIGIAGKGMSATALLLRESGWQISGSDEGFYPPVSDYLQEAGIPFANGYKKENIPQDTDVIVIGKNAKLTPEQNEEVAAALESGKTIKSFPDIIHELTRETNNIVVAGSYGKSTCTALLAWCLKQADKDPSYFIGEVTKGFEAHAHVGGGSVFVLEGDEYPSSNWDATSKFLHYNARSVLLTSATHDHVNVYPTHEEYLAPFKALVASLPEDGLLMVNSGEQHASALASYARCRTVTYGMNEKTSWHPEHIAYGMPTTFDLMRGDTKIASLTTKLLGAHNVENIVGVGALLLEQGLLAPQELETGVATFEGVKRRMELLSDFSQVPIFEGFGSSYEKARSAIEAVRLHYPDKPLVIVFEPHTFSWRNRANLAWYDRVFDEAKSVFVAAPAEQGAATHAQLSRNEILARIGDTARPYTPEAVAESLSGNEAVLILTSGSLEDTMPALIAIINERFPL